MAEGTPRSKSPHSTYSADLRSLHPRLSLEELEPRIAPTTFTDGQWIRFGDSDDNVVLVYFSGAGQVDILNTAAGNLGTGAWNADGYWEDGLDIGSIVFTGTDLTSELVVAAVDFDDDLGWILAPGGAHALTADYNAPAGSGGVLVHGPITSNTDVGAIRIDGTVWGTIDINASVEVLDIGFLGGDVDIDGDVGTFHIDTNTSLAAGSEFDPEYVIGSGATIDVDGVIGWLDIGGVNYGYDINQGIDPLGPLTTLSVTDFDEVENIWDLSGHGFLGISSGVVGSGFTLFNDTFATPQYLVGGDFTIHGYLEGRVDVDGGGADYDDFVDFYAFPVMAGDVIEFSANDWAVGLFDPTGALVATSNWDVLGATESFTAETSGLYRIAVATDYGFETAGAVSSGGYTIAVAGSTFTTLGGYSGDTSHGADITCYENAVDPGILGGINLTGALYGGTVQANGMVQVSAGELGVIDPDGNVWWLDMFSVPTGPGGVGGDVGRISTPGSWHEGVLYLDGGVPEDYDMQLMEIGGDAGALLSGGPANVGVQVVADGNIGAITIGGNLYPGSGTTWIRANSDSFGGPGYIDVLDIGGDFGALSGGDPLVGTGVGGNVRFVRVGGTIWASGPSGTSPLSPITITGSASGDPTYITDDSGGGIQVSVGAGTTLIYRYIPIRDLGPGVAITSMDVVGTSFSARVSGSVEIGEVSVAASPYIDPLTLVVTTPNFSFSPLDPSGEVDIFHLTGDIGTFTNSTTDGDLVYGTIGSADALIFRGPGSDIGITEYNTDSVIQPPVLAGIPPVRDQVPVRGIFATGDVPEVRAAGAIRDLIVQGYLGTVRANSDDVNTAWNEYWTVGIIPDHVWTTAYNGDLVDTTVGGDGATGVVYGAGADPVTGYAIVDLDVGAGLGQAGSGENANAGVFSPGIIGTVRARTVSASFIDPAIIGSGGIMNVLGQDSASIWDGIIAANELDDWLKYDGLHVVSGPVGTIRVSGIGSTIDGTRIEGFNIDRIIAEGDALGDSNGINNISVFAFAGGLNLVQADGPGILNSEFQTDGPIGDFVVTSPAGAFDSNLVQASTTLDLISAPAVTNNFIEVFLTVGTIEGDFLNGTTVVAGELEEASFTNDIVGFFAIAGPVGTIESTAGTVNSFILVTGAFGDVEEVSSFLDLQGALDVQGNVGTLTSVTGDLTGDAVIGGNVDELSFPNGAILADISIGGDLDNLEIQGSLGVPGGVFAVGGNLGRTQLGDRSTIAHVLCDLIIGGDVAGLDVTGGLTGNLYIGGIVRSLSFGQTVTTVANHMAVAGAIDYPGDVDVYSFTATAGQVITITTDTVGNGVAGLRVPDTVIGLYDPFGALLVTDDDGAVGTDSQIAGYVIPVTGTYYVAVANWPDGDPLSDPDYLITLNPNDLFNGNPMGDEGPYTLTIDGADVSGGALEPGEIAFLPLNNTIFTAQGLSWLQPFTIVGEVSKFEVGDRNAVANFDTTAVFMDDVSRMYISGSFNSTLTAGTNLDFLGDLSRLEVGGAAGGTLGAVGDAFTVIGDLDRLTVGGRGGPGTLLMDLTVLGDAGQMTVTGSGFGDITVLGDLGRARFTGDLGIAGMTQVTVLGDLQKLEVGDRSTASDLFSDLTVLNDLRDLRVAGDVWGNITVVNDARNITVAGNLGIAGLTQVNVINDLNKLTVGGRGVASDLNSDLIVGNDLRSLTVSNDVLGNINVGNDFRSGKITGDLGIHTVTQVNVGNDLRSLTVGSRSVVSSLFSNVTVGNDLQKLSAGPIWGDINVTNDVRQVSTTSTVLPQAFPPPNYVFDNGIDPNGSLTAGGEIRQVRQV